MKIIDKYEEVGALKDGFGVNRPNPSHVMMSCTGDGERVLLEIARHQLRHLEVRDAELFAILAALNDARYQPLAGVKLCPDHMGQAVWTVKTVNKSPSASPYMEVDVRLTSKWRHTLRPMNVLILATLCSICASPILPY